MTMTRSTMIRSTRYFLFSVSIVLSLLCNPYSTAQEEPLLTKQQLRALLQTSNTAAHENAADEKKIAAYYRAEEKRYRGKAQEFAEQAALEEHHPALMESKQGISCLCPAHFRYFAQYYEREAQKSAALAELHERTAQKGLESPR